LFNFCKYGISSSLQLLQFGICILFLQIWYFVFPLIFTIWYLHSVFAIFFLSDHITSRRYLFSFCNLIFCFLLLLCSGFLYLLIIATERDDSLQSLNVRLDGKNYSYWSYVMRNFFKSKKMWGYVRGAYMILRNIDEGYAALIDV